MVHWRKLFGALGRDGRRDWSAGFGGIDPQPIDGPEMVEPAEVALILLRNAVRLLDRSTVPPEVHDQLQRAIGELEKFIEARGS